jgi:GNAT superfamily N-acetyltransferase
VLGVDAFRVDGGIPPDAPGFYWAKVGVDDVARVNELEGAGFRVVDVNVTLTRGASPATHIAGGVEVARREHHEALAEIAGSCFRTSRFHLDPEIADDRADDVKREWIRSYSRGERGVELLAALDGDRPVGFLAVLESGRARVIDLVGVARDAQRRGVGSALVAAFVERHAPHADELRVGTQIANVPSLHLYAAHGFLVDSASYVLHRHTS